MNLSNDVRLTGRLTADPEVKVIGTKGNKVANFTLAVNNNFKNSDGEYGSEFIRCEAYGSTAEYIEKYFEKGKPMSVGGSLRVNSYDDKDGVKRTSTVVNVEAVQFVLKDTTMSE